MNKEQEEIVIAELEEAYDYMLSLEAKIAELEKPLCCNGCEYEECEVDTELHDLFCSSCVRIHSDNYEPKDM